MRKLTKLMKRFSCIMIYYKLEKTNFKGDKSMQENAKTIQCRKEVESLRPYIPGKTNR